MPGCSRILAKIFTDPCKHSCKDPSESLRFLVRILKVPCQILKDPCQNLKDPGQILKDPCQILKD